MGSKQLKTCGLIRKAIKIGEQVVLSSLDFSDLWKLELSTFCCIFFYSASIILRSNLPGCIAEQFSPIARQNVPSFRKATITLTEQVGGH